MTRLALSSPLTENFAVDLLPSILTESAEVLKSTRSLPTPTFPLVDSCGNLQGAARKANLHLAP